MHEAGVAGRQGDREAGRQQRPLTGCQPDVDGGDQVRAGIAGQRVARQRSGRMQPADLYPHASRPGRVRIGHRRISHRGKGYPRPVTEPAPSRGIDAGTGAEYRERLRTPWWWYPIGILVGVLLGAEFDFVMPQFLVGVPILVSVLVAVVVVWRISSSTVRVHDGRVFAGTRSLGVAEIDQTFGLGSAQLRRLVGRHGDPLAFTYIRPWIGPGVQLVLTGSAAAGASSVEPDEAAALPDDGPTGRLREPYWVLSSRHPERLLTAIETARMASR